jgi:hypothetical protein
MNHEHDPLEDELAALCPREPSANLERRIAERLATDDQPMLAGSKPRKVSGATNRWLWTAALTAMALAAVALAVGFLLPRESDRPVAEPQAVASPQWASAFDETLPSLWQLRATMDRPLGDIEALLDRHAERFPEPNHSSEPKPERARVFVFSRLNLDHDPLGEL